MTADDSCPKLYPGGLITGHLMRFDLSDGEREVWRCVQCGFTRIETRAARCRRCGEFKHKGAPRWCDTPEEHRTT